MREYELFYRQATPPASALPRGAQQAQERRHQFDPAGRVIAASVDGAGPIAYGYDAKGNATQFGAARLTYDDADRLMKRTDDSEPRSYSSDANGNELVARSESGG